MDISINGKDDEQLNLFGEQTIEQKLGLNERFIVPPFSVLDTRQGYWQDRKRSWIRLGIKSELGRGDNLTYNFGFDFNKYGHKEAQQETSIFDPVLCELVYQWFCPINGSIIDPFSGGSVRGIVACKTGRKYIGFDLSSVQIEANKINAQEIFKEEKNKPYWINDDSCNIGKYIKKDEIADMIFTCPPYFDLEVYSSNEHDLSNMTYDGFKEAYRKIISICCQKLKKNRFACFVIGDVRDKDGFYRGLTKLTEDCFEENGLKLYNDMILLNIVGTASIRAGKQFSTLRKVVKVHQNVLVFYKGDIKEIRNNFKELEMDY
jgi:DNA modification methylase